MRLKRQQIKQREKSDRKQNSLWSWIRTVIFAVALGFAISIFVKPVLIQGMSMYPAINEHDYIITSKLPYLSAQPRFGDVIVFKSSLRMLNGSEKDLIKRVIGLPGDTIEITGGKVYLNDEEMEEPYVISGVTPGDVPRMKIEEGHVFAMGDNRPGSTDSRDGDIGPVAMSDIKGKALIRLFPFDKIGVIK